MPDPKKKQKKQFSRDPDDIKKTVERDYPNYSARYVGKTASGRSEFRMTGKNSGGTFTLDRAHAFPAVDKELANQAKLKYNRNKNK